jgi:hypothetical protein
MKFLLQAVFNMVVVLAFTQSRDTSVFTVKAPATSVSVLPATDFLYKDMTRRFKLVKPAATNIDTIIFLEGTAQVKDSFLFIKPAKSKTAMLKIYVKGAGGKSVLAYVKEFEVRKFIEPKPNLDGVNCDSAIYKEKVIAQGYINVPINPDEALKRISHKIVSFEMGATAKGKVDTLKVSGNRLNYAMKDKIDSLQDGSVIEIKNIKYKMADDTFTIAQPLRIYLINDPVNKF